LSFQVSSPPLPSPRQPGLTLTFPFWIGYEGHLLLEKFDFFFLHWWLFFVTFCLLFEGFAVYVLRFPEFTLRRTLFEGPSSPEDFAVAKPCCALQEDLQQLVLQHSLRVKFPSYAHLPARFWSFSFSCQRRSQQAPPPPFFWVSTIFSLAALFAACRWSYACPISLVPGPRTLS